MSWGKNGYGQRGGTSKNAGKKATTYEATLPDGRVLKKRSFEVSDDEALLVYYWADGACHSQGIIAKTGYLPGWVKHTVPARKVP